MDWKQKLTAFFQKYRYVLLVVAVGFVLMTLPGGDLQEEGSVSTNITSQRTDPSAELEEVLSQIQGVGRVRVLLTVSQGELTLYETDEDRTDASDSYSVRTETVIITDSSRAQQGLVQQVIPPVYRGAVIVCQGGDQPSVRLAVVEAVSDVTGLTADKISVLKMK